jgi:hypothetical protein
MFSMHISVWNVQIMNEWILHNFQLSHEMLSLWYKQCNFFTYNVS